MKAGRVPEADQRWGRLWLSRSILELDRRGPDAADGLFRGCEGVWGRGLDGEQ